MIETATRTTTTRRAATDATGARARAGPTEARASFGTARALVNDGASACFVLVITPRRAARCQHHGWNNAGQDEAANSKACFSHIHLGANAMPIAKQPQPKVIASQGSFRNDARIRVAQMSGTTHPRESLDYQQRRLE